MSNIQGCHCEAPIGATMEIINGTEYIRCDICGGYELEAKGLQAQKKENCPRMISGEIKEVII